MASSNVKNSSEHDMVVICMISASVQDMENIKIDKISAWVQEALMSPHYSLRRY